MNGPNPVLLVRDHIGEHISELEGEREKLVGRLLEINAQLVLARTLRAIVGPQVGEAGAAELQGLESAKSARRRVTSPGDAPASPPASPEPST